MSDHPAPGIESTPEGRRSLAWMRSITAGAAALLVVSQVALGGLLALDSARTRRAVTDSVVVEHRARNEEAHDAQCRILLEAARALGEQAGLDVSRLPECPPPLPRSAIEGR